MRIHKYKRQLALIIALIMTVTIVFPIGTLAEGGNESEKKFARTIPSVFNPSAGEVLTIQWNFEKDHPNTSFIIHKGSGKDGPVIYQFIRPSTGGYVTNETTWDGKDDSGNVIPVGSYTIEIRTQDEYSDYPMFTSFGVTTSASRDIEIDPDLSPPEGKFKVHGTAEENTKMVKVFIDGNPLEKEATIEEGEWFLEVSLPEFQKVSITAVKTNETEVPEVDEEGNPIVDEEGKPKSDLETDTLELGPIYVLKHVVREHDRLTDMAEDYYGDSDKFTEIIKANDLMPPYVVWIGNYLLIFNSNDGVGEPPSSVGKGQENLCGIVDLITSNTIASKDPVNLATGNFMYANIDIEVNGNFPLSFSRFYNSKDHFNGDLGTNWHHNLEIRLQDRNNGTIEIIFEDGHREPFTLSNGDKYTAEPGRLGEIQKNSNGTYTLTYPDKSVYNFNERGQLIEKLDSNRNSTKFIYENLLLREIRNDSGYLLLQYYIDGRIRKISDNTGRYVEYEYSGMDLTSFRDTEGNIIEYKYDSENRLTNIISPRKDGNIVNKYDSEGRVIEQTLADGNTMYFDYDDANGTTTLTERDGSKVIYKYDDKYRITEAAYSDGVEKFTFNEKNQKTSFTDKKGNTFYYEYDDNGNIKLVENPLGQNTRYTYDHNNRMTLLEQPDGKTYSYTYDSKGNMLTSTDQVNQTTKYEYNSKGLPVKIILPDKSIVEMSYDNRGNLSEVKNAVGGIIKYEYDSLNRVKSVTDPNGYKTSYEYTNTGEIKKVTDAQSNSASFIYNANGKLEEAVDPYGRKTTYKFNKGDQLIEVVDQLGKKVSYEYDQLGNIKKITDKNGKVTEYKYDSLSRLVSVKDPESYMTSFEYDPNGNIVNSKDARGNTTKYEYDLLNRLVLTRDANNQETKYEYDSMGRIIKVINPMKYATEYEYDAAGRIQQVKDPLGNINSYTYNVLGLLETVTNAEGAVTRYQYDSMGQVTKMTDPEGAITQWEYDKNGNITKVTDALGNETKYTYDKINRIKTIKDAKGNIQSFEYTKTGEVASVTDENGNMTEYKYDAMDRLTEVIDAKGHSTKYVYDNIGNLIEVHKYRDIENSTIATFTAVSQTVVDAVYSQQTKTDIDSIEKPSLPVETVTGGEAQTVADAVYGQAAFGTIESFGLQSDTGMEHQITTYEYDGRGLLTKVKDASNKVTVYSYDENGNLISTVDRDGYTTSYEYDPTNLLKQITYNDGKKAQFDYNALGQLIKMQDWLGTTDMELDPLGRILKVTDFESKVTEYGWTPSGQKEFIIYPDGSQVSYTYDKTGNLKTVSDAYDKVTQYQYNKLGNLIERILPSGSKTEYKYDELSQIKEFTHMAPSGKVIDRYNYTYDAAGNKTNIYKNKSDLDIEALEGEDTENMKYKYDSLNQLVEVMKNNKESRKYFYDTLGNRVRLEEWSDKELKEAVNYQYDIMNRLIKTNDIHSIIESQTVTAFDENNIENEDKGDGNKEYKYDKRGNLIQISNGGKELNKYEFDATNALVEVINKQKENTKYTYDGFGNRVKTAIDLNHPGGDNRPENPGNGNGNNGNNGNGNNGNNGNGNNGNAYGHENGNNGNAYGQENGNNGNAYGHENGNNGNGNGNGNGNNGNGNNGNGNGGNPKPGWGQQYKRDIMEINYAIDITSPVNDILMIYGSHYQTQRYTYGVDRISMDMWEIEDHDNGWIPNGTGTNLSEDADRLYYLQDELNSTIKVIGENGKTSAHYNYDEFGRPESERKFDQNWPGPDNTFGYTGYQYEVSTGLYYAQARYYMPETGRFISEDPWKGNMTTPQTLNPYPYVMNNPLKYVDPLGLWVADNAGGASANKNSVINNTTNSVVKKNTTNKTLYSMCDLKEYIESIPGKGNITLIVTWPEKSGIYKTSDLPKPLLYDPMDEYYNTLYTIYITEQDLDAIAFVTMQPEFSSGMEAVSAAMEYFGARAGSAVSKLTLIFKGKSNAINASELKMSKTVQNHMNDIIKKGANKGDLARPYIDSNGTTMLVDEIMKGGTPVKDTVLKNGLRWDVEGTFRGSTGTWELVVDTSSNTIVHFNFVAK